MSTASFATSFAAKATIRIDGGDYSIGPIDLDCLLACAAEMRRLAGDPFAAIMPHLRDLPPDLQEKLFKEALAEHNIYARASPTQALIWALDKPDGLIFLLWYLIDRATPGRLSRDAITRYLTELLFGQPAEYAAIIEQLGDVSGYSHLSKAMAAAHRVAAEVMARATGPSSSNGSSNQSKPADEATISRQSDR